MKRTDLDFLAYVAKAIAILDRHPQGLHPDSLATQVGISARAVAGNHNTRSSALETLLKKLKAQGYRVEKCRVKGELILPPGAELAAESAKPLFRTRQQPECKTWIDPSFIDPTLARGAAGASRPVPRPSGVDTHPWRIPKACQPKPKPPEEKPEMPRSPKGRAAVRAVLQQMIETGEPLSQEQVCEQAGVGDEYLRTSPVMKAEYKTALALATTKQAALPEPVAEPEPEPDLRQQIADLEARNRELRQQLGAAQPPADLEAQIQQQLAYWEGIERDRAEVAQAAVADYKAAARRVAALRQFAVSLAPEPQTPDTQTATQTGGAA